MSFSAEDLRMAFKCENMQQVSGIHNIAYLQ